MFKFVVRIYFDEIWWKYSSYKSAASESAKTILNLNACFHSIWLGSACRKYLDASNADGDKSNITYIRIRSIGFVNFFFHHLFHTGKYFIYLGEGDATSMSMPRQRSA